jgi:hypothetical protein
VTDAKSGFTSCVQDATELLRATEADVPMDALNMSRVADMLAARELFATWSGAPSAVAFDAHGANCSEVVDWTKAAAEGADDGGAAP